MLWQSSETVAFHKELFHVMCCAFQLMSY